MTIEVLNELDDSIYALRGVANLMVGKEALSGIALERVSTLIEVLTDKMEEQSEALRRSVATA